MLELNLKRIKNLRFQGTYVLDKCSNGGDLLKDIKLVGRTVHMFSDYELAPTTYYIIDEEGCRVVMRHSAVNNAYSNWEEFIDKK